MRRLAAAALMLALTACTAPLGDLGAAPRATLYSLDRRSLDGDFRAAARVGPWTRIPVRWNAVSTGPRRYDWSSTDRIFASARAAGLRVVAVAIGSPGWQRCDSCGPETLPASPARYAEFVVDVYDRYRPEVVEEWNEVDLASFAKPLDPHRYADLARAVIVAFRGRSRPLLMAASLSPLPPTSTSYGAERYLSALYAEGLAHYVDLIGYHPYTGTGSWGSSGGPARLDGLRRLSDRAGAYHDLWLTEWGYPTVSSTEDDQDRYVADFVRWYRASRPRLRLGPAIYYNLRDAGTPRWATGLIRQDGTARPAYGSLVASR